MGKVWNNFIDQTKKSFMKYPCSFSGTILYTIFMTIFIDKNVFSDELLLSEFITREFSYFEFVDKKTINKIPIQYINKGNIIQLDIRDNKKLNELLAM